MHVLSVLMATLLSNTILEANFSLIDHSCCYLPTMAEQGQRVTMSCCPSSSNSWFSVKWFKEDPDWQLTQQDRTGEAVVFNKEGSGVVVDRTLSVLGRLVMLNMTDNGQGWYKCEVTGPAPVYNTATIRTQLTVVRLPKEVPRLEVVGNTVSCTVPVQSEIQIQIMWFIDGSTPPSRWVNTEYNRSLITIRQGMFSKVVVKCVAMVDKMYWGAAEVIMVDE